MEIIGYSERGAMNALFYGIAFKKDAKALECILKQADINITIKDAQFFMEFSMSEFGSPDLLIKIVTTNGSKLMIFVEAKASCGKPYQLEDAWNKHNDLRKGNKYDGYSSNLYYQLAMKKLYFDNKKIGCQVNCKKSYR